MSFETLAGGLELVLPTNNTKNWGTVVRNSTWKKINDHTHTGTGDGNKLSGSSLSDNSIDKAQLAKNLAGYVKSEVVLANNITADLNEGTIFDLDLSAATGSVNLTVLNPLEGGKYTFVLNHGATAELILWPAAFIFPDGVEPTQYSVINSIDKVEAVYINSKFIADWQLNLK